MKLVMLGASGAVGAEALAALAALGEAMPARLTLLNRRALALPPGATQWVGDVLDPAAYAAQLPGHDAALCTLGVGQPSQMSRAEFLRIDQQAVLDFGRAARAAGVQQFALLSSVGANPRSRSFYLRSKGELEQGLQALGFQRLLIAQPSMILTPANRYGLLQALTLAVWPRLDPLLQGPLQPLRGIRVRTLGRALVAGLRRPLPATPAVERLRWRELQALGSASSSTKASPSSSA